MPTHKLNGTELYYEVTGAGPWIVFAHGGEGTRLHWWAQVAALQHRFRCVTYDARGFGQSAVGAMVQTDNVYRDDLLSLLDLLRTGGCEAQVTLLGVIPRGDQIQLMRRSLAIVQPSLFEGWSTVVEDARLLGKRVLASDIAVHREQHPPGCRFFASESTESLADALGDWWATLAPGPDPAAEARASGDAGQAITAFGRQFLRIAGAPGFSETP